MVASTDTHKRQFWDNFRALSVEPAHYSYVFELNHVSESFKYVEIHNAWLVTEYCPKIDDCTIPSGYDDMIIVISSRLLCSNCGEQCDDLTHFHK